MDPNRKYTRAEWERRFLLARFPAEADVIRIRRITDYYIENTRLRLREQSEAENQTIFKLTQKLEEETGTARQDLVTTIYVTLEEFLVLTKLPAKILKKTRYSVPPFGIDVFEGELSGLVLAEAEFNSAAQATALVLPPFVVQEVTHDHRFTGGSLVRASRQDLQQLLAEHKIPCELL
jgi:CYTH domain-containing protein